MHMWQQWVNGALGLWVMIVPFLHLGTDLTLWMMALSGMAIVALSVEGAVEHTEFHERNVRHA